MVAVGASWHFVLSSCVYLAGSVSPSAMNAMRKLVVSNRAFSPVIGTSRGRSELIRSMPRYDLAWALKSFGSALDFIHDGYASGLISKGEQPRVERRGKRRFVVTVGERKS